MLGCYSFFAIAETSLFSLSPLARLKLKTSHPKLGALLERLLSRPQRLLTAIIVGNEASVIGATVLVTSLALSLWGERGQWLAMLVMVPALLLFGEIIPKSLALSSPETWVRRVAPVLARLLPLLTPIRYLLVTITRAMLTLVSPKLPKEEQILKEDDFLQLVEDSHRQGVIAPLERDLIVNLMSLSETMVSQIMVPRPDIFLLPLQMKLPELLKAVKKARFSRVPIYDRDPENIVGILHAKDLLTLSPDFPGDSGLVKKLLRQPYYVPENKRAFDLLRELQARQIRLALVVDEYGSLTGLVSVEDILEELFGEFREEFQPTGSLLEPLASGVYLLKSRLPLAELNRQLNLNLPTGDFDTVGGFVFHLFGELPHEGDRIEYDGLRFEVLKMKGTRILEILLETAPS